MESLKKFLFVINLLGVLPGCAYVQPYIQTVNLVPIQQELELGQQMSKEISKSMPLVNDPALVNRVRTIGNQLASALPMKNFNYQFYVVQNKAPNAFTIHGGIIYVQTGLLQMANDSELAGVLAHEIGHAYYRHPTRTLTRMYGLDYISRLIFKENQGKLQTLALQLVKTGVLNQYGRNEEFEADDVGYQLLKRARFPTSGLLSFFRKLQTLEGRSGTPLAFLSTHPPTTDRIARLEALERQGLSSYTTQTANGSLRSFR